MQYIIYNKMGEALRIIDSPPSSSLLQVKENEFIMEGGADDATQKIEFDDFDDDGQPINPRVVNKTPAEIARDNPPELLEMPFKKQPANITKEQLQDVLNRLSKLETKEKS